MDHRSIKRPRKESGPDGDSKETVKIKPTKTKKKSKKNKKAGKSNVSDETNKSSAQESTATAEGQTMAQVLSTFNRLEQSRFEAFKRSTFRGDAISQYVAHCLAAEHERAYSRGEKARQYLGGTHLGVANEHVPHVKRALERCPYVVDEQQSAQNNNVTNNNSNNNNIHNPAGNNNNNNNNSRPAPPKKRPKRSLEDMVATGQAEEITIVVNTLAKSYAQRLVTAARRVASSQGYSTDAALLPKHVLQAHHARLKAGMDPGFFLQKPPSTVRNVTCGNSAAAAAALGIVNRRELQRNAALAAQEEYDKYMEEQQKQKKAKQEEEKGQAEKKDESVPDEAMKEAEVET